MDVFSFIVFLIMFQVTATTITEPVTVVCTRASLITMTVTVVPNSVGLAASGQHNVVLPPQLILRETMRGSLEHTVVLQQQQPPSQKPCQAYANVTMSPP